ncbi:MAG: hypothetical protein DMF76_21775 [Acidobacteria bacterium]|nr:MAG: hypothetical protein DMF76_21775 [Acidobacteriota bacterium]
MAGSTKSKTKTTSWKGSSRRDRPALPRNDAGKGGWVLIREEERDEDELRSSIVEQLEQSLEMSRAMMTNLKLDPRSRERWTQLHTNTSQVLNQVLKDKQYREWEKRLKDLEASGHIPRKTGR